uniref:Nucleoid-associated protein ndpA n=1 Tax=Rheinheimera sp. BAL341 TaxID=1708203 RepID=A0A486XI29_9GAMM
MAIKHVIIHVVKRDNDGQKVFKKLRKIENSTAGMAAQLTDGLIELFSNAHLNIGEFGVDGDNSASPVFEQKLLSFYPQDDETCSDFVKLTTELADRYENIISRDTLQSVKGGFLVFYQYEKNGSDWFAVAILNKTEGIDVEDDLDVVASEILDLKKLHLGAAINLSHWKDGISTRYIRFRAGLASEVRDYFEEYIGCQRDKHAAQIETQKLKDAIQDFGKSQCAMTEEVIALKVAQAHDFIKEQQKVGNEIKLNHIANHVFPDQAETFSVFAKENHDLPEEIAIDPKVLKRYKKISGRGKGISISFDRELLNTTVKYDNGQLIFTDIPDSLRVAIEEDQKVEDDGETFAT